MSDNSITNFDSLNRFTPLLIVAVIAMAFAVGALWQRVQNLEKSSVAGTATATPAAANDPSFGKLPEGTIDSIPEITQKDHIRGNPDAKIKLIEYSDYYCPYCIRFHPVAQQALDKYGDDIAWVYRHFPLDTLHPNARAVAEISECLADQAGEDAFWQFTDSVYEETPATVDTALDLAAQAGGNRSSLESCYNNGKFKDKVEAQYQAGADAGITGTPGNLIINPDGDVWKLPYVTIENLSQTLDEALNK